MARRLTVWLEETFTEQLLLGNHWLHDQKHKKQRGVKCDPEREWGGLYHDNGSCLDITNDIHPDRNRLLHIIQLSPLVLTDGQTEINPLVSPECRPSLQLASSLHGVIAVRKYTIRYTSYGPPRDKLRFVLHAVDWVGYQSPPSEPLQPLWSDTIAAVVQQLHDIRACEDRRCLASDTAPIMDGAHEGESQSHTQHGFGTQIAHSFRPRPSQDEPQVLGVKSLEPVLAGNTRREDIRPRPAAARPSKEQQLRSLLAQHNESNASKSTTASTDNFIRPPLSRPQKPTESPASQLFTQLPPPPTQTPRKGKEAASSSPQTSRSPRWEREVPLDPRRNDKVEEPRPGPIKNTTPKEREPNVLQQLASECSWMRDLEFSREALKVPNDQFNILQKQTSWYKPQAGHQFPDGNVPITILMALHRIADENAAMEAAPDSDDEMDEDPSPEEPVSSVDPSPQDPVLQASPDEPNPSSPVSWPASPSPEPPKIASRFGQLPPDSSFEPPEDAVHQDIETTVTSAAAQVPISIESSNEEEPTIPPSSPPVQQGPLFLDEEMEMEEFVPQGLGEDSVGGASEVNTPVLLQSPPPRPVVQVKETPYTKGKNGQIVEVSTSSRPEKQRWSGTSKNTSSGSIVYGTYNDKPMSQVHSPSKVRLHATTAEDADDDTQMGEQQPHSGNESSKQALDDNMPDPGMGRVTVSEAPVVLPPQELVRADDLLTPQTNEENNKSPEPSPISAQISPQLSAPRATPGLPILKNQSENETSSAMPPLAPGPTKRKLEHSPPKKSSRRSKRREIKIVGFGEELPASADPASTLRHHREESLRKFRENRKSSTSFESRAEPATEPGTHPQGDAMEVDSPSTDTSSTSPPAMSPRHVSLYEDPSPTEPAQITAAVLRPASVASPVARPQKAAPAASPPVSTRLSEQPRSITTDPGNRQNLSVFETFKTAYPEYTGCAKHFQGQCIQMLDLDRADKMVPKWQWDDFVIRNRTDYTGYVSDCLDQGSDAEPYHRFYKDTIRDTIYRKGVIESPATLQLALQQFGVQPPVPKPSSIARSIPQKEKRSRASLPSAFNQPKAPLKSYPNGTHSNLPRHSLPTNSQVTQHTPAKSLHKTQVRTPAQPIAKPATANSHSTTKPSRISLLSLDGPATSRASSVNGDAPESTGDVFRDFVFAQKRMTSLTGSTKVSSKANHSKRRES
ncbi:hypothetical protein CC86DRAFT_429381 [Ophiobolus disseminans]|uniref:Telomere replication protein EST3 n=1 Tax=Ophiobolus disseminans TaxID=1469910 RepID=A0A6A6ZFQ0_9PLEO|nr:hypothetical protein CC86DRAFT_429381 [Ophiobolus disseminans]